MPVSHTHKISFSLSPADAVRLEKFAPLFDIDFRLVDELIYALKTTVDEHGSDVMLPAAIAHRRLLAEISERAVKWVHFHLDQSCRNSLLGQGDARLSRVAELYALNRDALRQKAFGR